MPKLTKRNVDAIQSTDKDVIIFDDHLPGFGLRVKPSGTKSYVIRYRHNGRNRSYVLGRHGVLTPDQARKRAKEALGDVSKGIDPSGCRRADRDAPTMRELATDYLELYAIHKRPSSVRNDTSMLDNIILPRFGPWKVSDVGRRDIEKLRLVLKQTPYRANRVLALLSKMFALAVDWGWRPENPVRGIPKFQEHKRDRWLDDDELARLFAAMRNHPNQRAANAIRLMVLTGARRSEVLTATWDQFTLEPAERAIWIKPAHTTKQKRTERLPLGANTVALLVSMQQKVSSGSKYLFPGDAPGKPLSDIKRFWRSILRDASISDARIHDLRHTYASHLVSSGMSLVLVGKLLGHTQPQTTMRYAHLADDPLRAATNRFGSKLGALQGSSTGTVVDLEEGHSR